MVAIGVDIDISNLLVLFIRHVVSAYLAKRTIHLPHFLKAIGRLKPHEDTPIQLHIQKLREELSRGALQAPQLVRVRGVFYPALLLAPGWWERQKRELSEQSFAWKAPLQEWLFRGFELWGPSWDLNVDDSEYLVGQVGWIDEVNSLLVIAKGRSAELLREYLSTVKMNAFPVEITGTLLHRSHLALPWNLPFSAPKGESFEYCILIDDERNHGVSEILTEKATYSAYLWKCLAPREWLQTSSANDLVFPTIEQSFFIWEHADITNQDVFQFALDSLEYKHMLLEKRYGELILLQKSASFIPGNPVYPTKIFRKLLEDLSDSEVGKDGGK